MRKISCPILIAAACIGLGVQTGQAGIITLSPADINGGSSSTVQFSDANLTLTPFVGGVQDSFNASSTRLGIDVTGTSNVNAFNDPDTTAGNGNDETLEFIFASNAGLTELSWDFARADGPLVTDGIRLSGFLADPTATLTGPGTFDLDYSAGTLSFQLSVDAFTGTDGVLTLNAAASAGQTLVLTVNDSNQAGAQLPITGISYDNDTVAIPEPSTIALLAICMGATMVLRRRR